MGLTVADRSLALHPAHVNRCRYVTGRNLYALHCLRTVVTQLPQVLLKCAMLRASLVLTLKQLVCFL